MLPLEQTYFPRDEHTLAGRYAARLLASLGAQTAHFELGCADVAVQAAGDWAASGLMHLTGEASGPPLQGPGAIASCARGALESFRWLAPAGLPEDLDGAGLLSERAALLGLQRQGSVSPNGSCHLLEGLDGWLALNLAREDDWSLLPAWLETEAELPLWQDVREVLRSRSVAPLVERGRLMGLAVADANSRSGQGDWYRIEHRVGRGASKPADSSPLVVDLSSLWAGPLCSHLLGLAGARVIKVESTRRPDGARAGSPAFYDLLNAGKASVALDLSVEVGRRQLAQLLGRADIVIEGSRPRALCQMGINAERILPLNPGLVWVGLTGYGRARPQGDWVAFGDDAAVAAGVAAATADPPLFCGDALADPLTGIHAACAALAFWRAGGGVLLSLSLCDVAAQCLNFLPGLPRGRLIHADQGWLLQSGGARFVVARPLARAAAGPAAELGADTERVLEELQILC